MPGSFPPHVRELLASVDRELRLAIRGQRTELDAVAKHLVLAGGKRLRPTLTLLSALDGKPDEDELARAAAAVELLHAAALLHDDVMDRAPTRRGRPTTNLKWGDRVATFAGTYLLARAMELLAALGDEINIATTRLVAETCVGQLKETERAYDWRLSPKEHVEIISSKTAALFELSCLIGGLLAHRQRYEVSCLADYGRLLGIAFQLTDDVLDLEGTPEGLGKSPKTDLREGIYTLPILLALSRNDARAQQLQRILQRRSMSSTDLRQVLTLVTRAGTSAEARTASQRYTEEALARLGALPNGDTRRYLTELATSLTNRRA